MDLRQKKGNSNPRVFVNGWAEKFTNLHDRNMRRELTKSDIAHARVLMNTKPNLLTEDGILLKEEAKVQVEYYERMVTMNKILPKQTYSLKDENHAIGTDDFLLTAHKGEFDSATNS